MVFDYKTLEELKEVLIGKTIVKWDKDWLLLDDKTKIEIVCSEADCCANAYGEFESVNLEAIITDVRLENARTIVDYDGYETHTEIELVILHNQGSISKANCYANNGNGDYYYSACAVKIKNNYFKILESRLDEE